MKTLFTTAFILAASTASAENICYRQVNPLDYQCRYDAERNRCDCREAKHGETRQQSTPPTPAPNPNPDPEPECKGKCEPDRETDPDGWQDWRDHTPRGPRHVDDSHMFDGKGKKGGREHGGKGREKGERSGEHGKEGK
jgi:hypothetical protein